MAQNPTNPFDIDPHVAEVYDKIESSGEDVRDQLREFVLGYFMRVSHLREPQVAVGADQPPVSGFMRMLSWIPEPADSRVGFGYEQLLYKLRETGEVKPVAAEDRGAIVDLRAIGPVYDWVAQRKAASAKAAAPPKAAKVAAKPKPKPKAKPIPRPRAKPKAKPEKSGGRTRK